MLAYARPYRLALVVGGLLSLATAATGLALPLVVRELIDGLGGGLPVGGWLLLMTALVVANAAIGAVGSVVLERTGESVVLASRRRLVSRLIRLRLSAVESTEPGDLMARVSGSVTQPGRRGTRAFAPLSGARWPATPRAWPCRRHLSLCSRSAEPAQRPAPSTSAPWSRF